MTSLSHLLPLCAALLYMAGALAIGHWFANREQQLGASVLRWRLAGAALMLAAIALVMFG